MPRILPRIVGFLLAVAVAAPAPSASAQFLARFRRQQTPVRKGRSELNTLLSDEHQRLTEMQVELALLSDIATFPYPFSARANGNTLELSGSVPNDAIRQRAMELARRTTVLRGIDGLKINPKLSVQSILRPPRMVEQDGTELLQKELGAHANQMSLEARPNGVVALTGRIDSVESKLEVSKLLRRLPGCTAVINELTIEPVLLDGQRMVRVTRNNMLFLPPSALGLDQEALAEVSPSTVPEKTTPRTADRQLALSQPTIPPPTPLRSGNLDAREGELRLPNALPMKQPNTPRKPVTEKVGSDWEAFAPSKLPVKWGRPTGSWEEQAKDLEAANVQPAKTAPPQTKLVDSLKPQPSQPQDKLPTPIREVGGRAKTNKARTSAAAGKTNRAGTRSSPDFAETREETGPVLTWRRPGSSEESEPKSPAPTKEQDDSAKPSPPPAAALKPQSARRWPPAYVTGPPPSQGRPGVIVFEDDPPSPPKPAPAVIATTRPVAAADLQRKIKSLCGRQAREVVAATQHDGSVLVRVKVANRFIEEQLSRKILALPEMTSPRVRLLMEIEP